MCSCDTLFLTVQILTQDFIRSLQDNGSIIRPAEVKSVRHLIAGGHALERYVDIRSYVEKVFEPETLLTAHRMREFLKMAINLTSERELHDELIKEMTNQISFSFITCRSNNVLPDAVFHHITPSRQSPGLQAITTNRPVSACHGLTNR